MFIPRHRAGWDTSYGRPQLARFPRASRRCDRRVGNMIRHGRRLHGPRRSEGRDYGHHRGRFCHMKASQPDYSPNARALRRTATARPWRRRCHGVLEADIRAARGAIWANAGYGRGRAYHILAVQPRGLAAGHEERARYGRSIEDVLYHATVPGPPGQHRRDPPVNGFRETLAISCSAPPLHDRPLLVVPLPRGTSRCGPTFRDDPPPTSVNPEPECDLDSAPIEAAQVE